jgi:hypothetical protein
VATRIHDRDRVREQARAPQRPVSTSSRAGAAGAEGSTRPDRRSAAPRPAHTREPADGWTWKTDPAEAELPSPGTPHCPTWSAAGLLIRAFGSAHYLIR